MEGAAEREDFENAIRFRAEMDAAAGKLVAGGYVSNRVAAAHFSGFLRDKPRNSESLFHGYQ